MNGALMKNGVLVKRWGLLLGALLWVLVGCVPQTLVTQPNLRLHIANESGEVVPATVTLYWWEYPHRRQRAVTIVESDAQGMVMFEETTAIEMLQPLVPHGVPAYNWSFCVEAESYKTLIGTISNVEPGDEVEIRLTVRPGTSLPVCADFGRLPSHPGTVAERVEFSGGEVHGVYEVDAIR